MSNHGRRRPRSHWQDDEPRGDEALQGGGGFTDRPAEAEGQGLRVERADLRVEQTEGLAFTKRADRDECGDGAGAGPGVGLVQVSVSVSV